MKEKTRKILSLLVKNERMSISEISEAIGVSQVTARKHINFLEEEGLVKREQGYAKIVSSDDSIRNRIAHDYDEKRKIAFEASKLVNDGDSIMLGNGSCAAILADILITEKEDLTFITNSYLVADYLRKKKGNFNLILLGGNYQLRSQCTVGPLVSQCAKNFLVNNYFIGVDGYSDGIGFSTNEQGRAQAIRDMSNQCVNVIVLAVGSKMNSNSTVPLNLGKSIKRVITNSEIKKDVLKSITSEGIEVTIV